MWVRWSPFFGKAFLHINKNYTTIKLWVSLTSSTRTTAHQAECRLPPPILHHHHKSHSINDALARGSLTMMWFAHHKQSDKWCSSCVKNSFFNWPAVPIRYGTGVNLIHTFVRAYASLNQKHWSQPVSRNEQITKCDDVSTFGAWLKSKIWSNKKCLLFPVKVVLVRKWPKYSLFIFIGYLATIKLWV